MGEAIIHAAIVVALIGAYVALTITGHDGTAIIAAIGGYGSAAGVSRVSSEASSGSSSSSSGGTSPGGQ